MVIGWDGMTLEAVLPKIFPAFLTVQILFNLNKQKDNVFHKNHLCCYQDVSSRFKIRLQWANSVMAIGVGAINKQLGCKYQLTSGHYRYDQCVQWTITVIGLKLTIIFLVD